MSKLRCKHQVLVAHVSCTTRSMGKGIQLPFHKFQNAQHVTWSSGSRVISWGVIHAEIVWSDLGMVCVQMMFSEVVCKIFDPGANEQWIGIMQPYLPSKSLVFTYVLSIVSWPCHIQFQWQWKITVNWCGWLRESHFLKNETNDYSLFGIDNQSAEFCFCSRHSNKS